MMMATFGLVTPQSLDQTTGGFLTGDGDMVNAGGYAVTSVDCSGTGDVKDIPVDKCTASVDPTTNPITAKLIKSFTLLDAMTPALPVYFGSEIDMQAEEVSGLIIAGESTSTFYLDTRTGTDLASTPAMTDLQPVFQIVQGSEIEDGDAEDMESAIVQNQELMGWWMNFDNGFVSVLAELPGRSQNTAILARLGKGDAGQGDRPWLAVILDQTWLVIKGVDLRWTTVHEEEDHSFRPWSVMGLYRTICKEIRSTQQTFKSQSSETGAAAFQKTPSRNQRNSICSRLTRLNDHVVPQSRYRNSLEASRV